MINASVARLNKLYQLQHQTYGKCKQKHVIQKIILKQSILNNKFGKVIANLQFKLFITKEESPIIIKSNEPSLQESYKPNNNPETSTQLLVATPKINELKIKYYSQYDQTIYHQFLLSPSNYKHTQFEKRQSRVTRNYVWKLSMSGKLIPLKVFSQTEWFQGTQICNGYYYYYYYYYQGQGVGRKFFWGGT
eukprot:TRINITY_DN3760_c0_g1_i3.p3 TRINITY_DN3760_c0_g1~~TRINITY_DN3760_c0_g1_i3.p3  ORF type:complete len:191 (+),score=-14.24 TRINITY_DN3760_c0_g1_i3:162-734(+)